MEAKSFGNTVFLRDGADLREITCIHDALLFLDAWPMERRGPIYNTALRACRAACDGSMAADRARSAFLGFARSTGILEKTAVSMDPWKLSSKRGRIAPV